MLLLFVSFTVLQNHDFARYVLPVTESEIKNQASKAPAVLNETVQNVAYSSSSLPLSQEEQQTFLKRLHAEFETIRQFQSDVGKPSTTELRGLDGDALEQLESDLSTEDQYVTIRWSIGFP